MSRTWAMRSRCAGLRRKLILRFVVTASGTGPIEASTATYIAKSVRPIIVGPEIVPPGRSDFGLNLRRTRQPRCQVSSMIFGDSLPAICENSRASKSATCCAERTPGRLPVTASIKPPPCSTTDRPSRCGDQSRTAGLADHFAWVWRAAKVPAMNAPVRTAPVLLRENLDDIAVLTLNRPAARNSLSEALIAALTETLRAVGDDRSIRAVVLAANGPGFCAGHDMKEMTARRSDPDRGRAYFNQLMESCSTMMQTIVHLPKPVIAIV